MAELGSILLILSMDNLERDYNLSEISILTFPSKHFCIAALWSGVSGPCPMTGCTTPHTRPSIITLPGREGEAVGGVE